jgi:hypothetical protein
MAPHCIMHAAAELPILFLITVFIEKNIICREQDSSRMFGLSLHKGTSNTHTPRTTMGDISVQALFLGVKITFKSDFTPGSK